LINPIRRKHPSLLLISVGISNLGDWIYFIALNLMVLNMTNSPTAVAGLYILKPIADILTTFWAGSVIDRLNKRRIMIILDLLRALLVGMIPFVQSIWSIYAFVLMIHMASSFFSPTSTTYMTQLIPPNHRKRFNSLHHLMTSGAFLLGPGIAGLLFIVGSPIIAIYMNALSFLISAIILFFLPNLETTQMNADDHSLSFKILLADWKEVLKYTRQAKYMMCVYFLFNSCIVLATAIDSQEVVFTRQVLHLSESSYGVLVSIAGAGVVVGSLMNSIIVKWLQTRFLIGVGTIFIAIGYLIYAFSTTFFMAAVGFFLLAFFLSFANTGFLTFYQNNIPVDMMGRVSSVFGMFLAILQIAATLAIGFTGDLLSVRMVVVFGSVAMFILAFILFWMTLLPSKGKYYRDIQEQPFNVMNSG
jgi:predicted MFS family arabinose efflux permease